MHGIASTDSPNLQQESRGFFSLRGLAVLFFVFLAYFLAAKFNVRLISLRPPAAAIWAPAGIALAAALLYGRRVAPAVFLATLVIALSTTSSWLMSLTIASGNTIEVLVGCYLVNRFAGGARAFSRPADFLRFCLFAGGLATSLGAIVGARMLVDSGAAGSAGLFATFLAWWAGDALGVLVVTPFLVLLLDGRHHPLHLKELAEIVVLLIGLSLVSAICFGPASQFSENGDILILLSVPFLVWAAIRFCPLEASGACLLLCGFATWGSLHGYGPFANGSASPLSLASYVCMATAMTLTGAATVASQREVSEQLLENLYRLEGSKDFEISRLASELEFFRDELTRRVHARSRSEAPPPQVPDPVDQVHLGSNDVIWLHDAETENILYVSPSYETVSGRSRADLIRDPHAWLDAVIPEDREHAVAFVGQDFPDDRLETTYRIQRPDGSIRWIFDRGFVIRDPSGRPVRYLGLASDITELVRQGSIVPPQLERRSPTALHLGEAGTQTRRKQE